MSDPSQSPNSQRDLSPNEYINQNANDEDIEMNDSNNNNNNNTDHQIANDNNLADGTEPEVILAEEYDSRNEFEVDGDSVSQYIKYYI